MTRTPSRPIRRRPNERRRSVHIVIHRLWKQDSRRRSVVYRQEGHGPGLVTVVMHAVGSRLIGHPRFVVCRRFVIESALAEANSFLGGCQPFCNIPQGLILGLRQCVTAVTYVNHFTRRQARFDPAKSRQYPRTVARTWRYGCDPGSSGRPRRLASETNELTNGNCVPTGMRIHRLGLRMPYATRRDSRGQGQADLPAQQPSPCAGAWVPAADADPGRPGHRGQPARQGPSQAHCVIRRRI